MYKSEYGHIVDELKAGPIKIRKEQFKQRVMGTAFALLVAATCVMLWVMG